MMGNKNNPWEIKSEHLLPRQFAGLEHLCAKVGMGWEQLGGQRDKESRECTLRRDGKQIATEKDAVSPDGRRRERY